MPTTRVSISRSAIAAAALSAQTSRFAGAISPRQMVQRASSSFLRPSLRRADRKDGARSSCRETSSSAAACMASTVLRERPRSALVRPVESIANWRPRQLSQIGPRLMIFLAVSRILSLGFSGFSKLSSLIMTLHIMQSSFWFIRACNRIYSSIYFSRKSKGAGLCCASCQAS